jgi:hypothetical protein
MIKERPYKEKNQRNPRFFWQRGGVEGPESSNSARKFR